MAYTLFTNSSDTSVFLNGYTNTAIVCFNADGNQEPIEGISVLKESTAILSGLTSYYDEKYGCQCVKCRFGGAKVKVNNIEYTEEGNTGLLYKSSDDKYLRIVEYGNRKFWCVGSSTDFIFKNSTYYAEVDYDNELLIPDTFIDATDAQNTVSCTKEFTELINKSYSLKIGETSIAFTILKSYEELLSLNFTSNAFYLKGSSSNANNVKFYFTYNGCPIDCSCLSIKDFEVAEGEGEVGYVYGSSKNTQYNEGDSVGSFSDYPYVFLSPTSTYNSSSDNYKISLPYGEKPDVDQETYVISNVADYDGTDLSGNYVLILDDEGESTGEYSCEIDETTYYFGNINYNSSYTRTGTIYKRWCIYTKDVSYEEATYSIKIYDNSGSYNSDPITAFGDNGTYVRKSDYGTSYGTKLEISLSPAESEDGRYKQLYAKANIDNYGKTKNSSAMNLTIHMTPPSDVYFSIVGSSGSKKYTGFYEKEGRFFPSEFITANVSAKSSIGITCTFTGGTSSAGIEYDLSSNGEVLSKKIKISRDTTINSILGQNKNASIGVTITDEAGNTTSSKACDIRYITKLFRTQNENLVEQSSTYSHKVYSMDSNSPVKISQNTNSSIYSTRKWNEIWYPSTHGSPLNEDGTIDHDKALSIAKSYANSTISDITKASYDILALDSTGEELDTDSEGRYVQASTGGWDTTKVYSGFENSSSPDTYWIIDNSGESEFKLEFEYFDFSTDINTLRPNPAAPSSYKGDMLCVYDASAEGATTEMEDEYGNTIYNLSDSTKLNLLFTLRGSYRSSSSSKFTLVSSNFDGGSITDSGNGFIVSNIFNTNRICIIPYTDYGDSGSSVASGFKLKAGKENAVSYSNYDCSESTGEFWVHKVVSAGSADSCSGISSISLSYDYYSSVCENDFENGSFSLSEKPSNPVFATFVAMLHLGIGESTDPVIPYQYFDTTKKIYNFATSEDDFQDYTTPAFYVQRHGVSPVKTQQYSIPTYDSGRIQTNSDTYAVVPDTGIVTFSSSSIPLGRIFGDYYYHTMYRLTSDGYGDLYFYSNGVLIPDSSDDSPTDWTYVDLKIVNEGTTALDSGTLQFIPRGYMTTTNGTTQVVDTVIDANRPWDIQEGTTQETVKCTGAKYASSYALLGSSYAATRKNAYQAKSSQTCVFGTLSSKQTAYVRVFWCISNSESGNSWVDITRGAKTFSAEIAGRYFIFTS